MKNEQSSVVFRVPDFTDADGIVYTDIEVIVEMDGDIRDTVQLVKTLERPLTKRSANEKGRRLYAQHIERECEIQPGGRKARHVPGISRASSVTIIAVGDRLGRSRFRLKLTSLDDLIVARLSLLGLLSR